MPLCLLTVDDVGRAGKMKPGRVGMVTQRLGGWSVEQWHQNPDWLSYIPLFRFRLYFVCIGHRACICMCTFFTRPSGARKQPNIELRHLRFNFKKGWVIFQGWQTTQLCKNDKNATIFGIPFNPPVSWRLSVYRTSWWRVLQPSWQMVPKRHLGGIHPKLLHQTRIFTGETTCFH